MPVITCNHLKENGIYCGSPALRGRDYCYYHLTLRGRRLARAQARRRGQPYRLQLPLLENIHAVQATLTEVLQALADGQLETKTAGLLLYGLQQASSNLHNPYWGGECPSLEDDDENRALDFPSFEQKFGVPPGIDLEAEPEVALEAAWPQAEDHPELVKTSQQQPEPPQQSQPGSVPERVSAPATRADRSELTFEAMQQQLHDMQRRAHQAAAKEELKKPAASVAPEATETANSA